MQETPSPLTATITDVAPDWITATAVHADAREQFEIIGCDLITAEQRKGPPRTAWSWMGYNGAHCGGVSVGERPDSTILRVSGHLAGLHWQKIERAAENISRIDLAVTARVDPETSDLAKDGYALACDAATRRGEKLHVGLIQANTGGGTLYLGSRKSEMFGRLYDKRAQTGDPFYDACWRWEVEYKGKHAVKVARILGRAARPSAIIQTTVYNYFADRGLPPPWDDAGWVGIRGPQAPRTDDEKRLCWIRETVGPIISGLMQRCEPSEVWTALGIVAYVGDTYDRARDRARIAIGQSFLGMRDFPRG